MFRLRPPLEVSQDIVVIEISDDTLKNLNSWPLPRDFHASLLDVLREYGARMAVFDVLFTEPTLHDEEFSSAIKDAGNVYLPLVCSIGDGHKKDPVETDAILAGVCGLLKEAAAGTGHINIYVDADGKVRKAPLFIKYRQEIFPHLALKAACDWLRLDIRNLVFTKDKVIVGNRLSIPVLRDGSFLVNYPGKWEKSFLHLSYFSILKSYLDIKRGMPSEIDLSVIKDKACFIGLTAAGTSDLKPMPLEGVYPMLGLQASVFNSIINRDFIRKAGVFLNALIGIFIFILSLIICLRFSAVKALMGSVILGLFYFIISTGLFILCGVWADLFLPVLIIGLTYIGATLYRFLEETRKKQLLEKELDIAREIQRSFLPEDIKEFHGLKISSFMQPAKFVAGDLYDIFIIDDKRIGVFIGDVSGKGVPASLIMAQTISLFRIFSRRYFNCGEVLEYLNKELYGKLSGRFVTCLYMIIDIVERKVSVSSAGHSPVLVHKMENNSVLEAELSADLPLGVMEDTEYKDVIFNIEKGDQIIVFTDGLTEARNVKKEEFGLEKVKDIIMRDKSSSSGALCGAIKHELSGFSHHTIQHDDVTLITLFFRFNGGAGLS